MRKGGEWLYEVFDYFFWIQFGDAITLESNQCDFYIKLKNKEKGK